MTGGFGAQAPTVQVHVMFDVLLDTRGLIHAAQHGRALVACLDSGSARPCVRVKLGTTEHDGQFIGMADGAIGIQKAVKEAMQGGVFVEKKVMEYSISAMNSWWR